ncbi:DUF4238 domain-containing protein [Bradyrhizobium jicamae]|uniref:DUF4238 domain-containing protein n=1 Tax=Bradyrhizobium jicamae TaxID=280332 RepID=UPI001BA50136|nr:DUF4238 domain-containing protein [Bradyrhizobium jicamae]MBR0756147.1 DUF4238 domain-containing protein [Bradyrhizobium jicamae]
MSGPKRHHWWPQLQSRHWTNSNGTIHAVRSDGTSFTSSPANIGLEGDLYTRYDLTGSKDLTIERWFSVEIEAPFAKTLDYVSTIPSLSRKPFKGDPEKRRTTEHVGFIVRDYTETIALPQEHRSSLSRYIAALIVRNPRYLKRIQDYHSMSGTNLLGGDLISNGNLVKTIALDNMLRTFDLYCQVILRSEIFFIKRESPNEFLFSDAGVSPEEPWDAGPVPFDVYAPLTPDLAVAALPAPRISSTNRAILARVNSRGVARFNRIAVGQAERFVFSRTTPPIDFIKKHFGLPPPKSFGHRFVDGRMEIQFDRDRDRE